MDSDYPFGIFKLVLCFSSGIVDFIEKKINSKIAESVVN
jgi:hypothetical protein